MELSVLYLKKALRIDPNYPLNSYQLALSYKKLGDWKKAVQYLENALKLNPNFKDAKAELKKIAN